MTKINLQKQSALTQARLRELLAYDPKTGIFTRRVATGRWLRNPVGEVVGTPQGDGAHLVIRVDGVLFLAHRLAWLYMTGAWPADQIDHRDKNKQNNRWLNLREATDLFNRQNMPMQRNNKSGEPGVRRRQDTGRWTAEIQVDGRVHRLGCFDSKDDAIRSRRRAKLQFHPFGAEGALDGG